MIGELPPLGGIIPCAGEGKKFRPITLDRIPKPLFQVGGKELVRYSLDLLDHKLVHEVVFTVGHKAEDVKRWVNNANLPHLIVKFAEQTQPEFLGAVTSAVPYVSEDVFVLSAADEIRTNLDLEAVMRFHQQSGRLATVVATYKNNLSRERLLTVRENDSLIISTELQPKRFMNDPNAVGLVKTGFLILDKGAVEFFDSSHSAGYRGIIDPLCDAGQIGAYIDPRIIYFNVGVPDEYFAAEAHLASRRTIPQYVYNAIS